MGSDLYCDEGLRCLGPLRDRNNSENTGHFFCVNETACLDHDENGNGYLSEEELKDIEYIGTHGSQDYVIGKTFVKIENTTILCQ